MAKTRGAHSFRSWVRQGPSPSAAGPAATGPSASSVAADPSIAVAGAGPSVLVAHPTATPATPALAAGDAEGSSSVAPTQRRYHTRVGPTPPAPSHPRPARRAPSTKRAQTSGIGESST